MSLRVLVVDDCQDTRESLAVLLRLWGHSPYLAWDGHSALATAETCSPEVVFLDIGLPGPLTGWDVARRLRDSRGADVMLVAVSGFGQTHDSEHSRAAGIERHLVKPAEPEELKVLLDEALSRAQSRLSCVGDVVAGGVAAALAGPEIS